VSGDLFLIFMRIISNSPEATLAAVRLLSETATTAPQRRNVFIPVVVSPISRERKVYHPWKHGSFSESWQQY